MLTVEIRNLVVGAACDNERVPPVAIDLLSETLTVRELIACTVEEQIQDLLVRCELDAQQARQKWQQYYLTQAGVMAHARQQVTQHPLQKPPAPINTQAEIGKALAAFEHRGYIILVDGQQAEALDETLVLHAASRITFVRLAPLVGG